MEVVKWNFFLTCLAIVSTVTVIAAGTKNGKTTKKQKKEEEKLKKILEPFIGENFKQCECNKDRFRVMEEMGFTRDSKEMIDFYTNHPPLMLHNKDDKYMLSGGNFDMPLNFWFKPGKYYEWLINGRDLDVEVKQKKTQLIQTQSWIDPNTRKKKTATTTWGFSFSARKEKRVRMVTVLESHKAVCIYQEGHCPAGYAIG